MSGLEDGHRYTQLAESLVARGFGLFRPDRERSSRLASTDPRAKATLAQSHGGIHLPSYRSLNPPCWRFLPSIRRGVFRLAASGASLLMRYIAMRTARLREAGAPLTASRAVKQRPRYRGCRRSDRTMDCDRRGAPHQLEELPRAILYSMPVLTGHKRSQLRTQKPTRTLAGN